MATVRRVAGPGAKVLQNLLAGVKDNKQERVGWFESARYEDGTPVAYVAAIQNYGYPRGGIPSRNFMETTIGEREVVWRQIATQGAQGILRGQGNVATVLDMIGQQASGDIAKTIASIYDPPLKPATIAARRRRRADKKTVGNLTKPLVDSGLMISTVTNAPVEDAE